MPDVPATCTDRRRKPLAIFERSLKLWMSKLARGAIRAESTQIIKTRLKSHMSVLTVGSVSTKASLVPRTILDQGFLVDVKEKTLGVIARVKVGEEVTGRHLG